MSAEVQSLANQVNQLRTAADAADGGKSLPEIVQTLERHRLTAAKVDDAIKVRRVTGLETTAWVRGTRVSSQANTAWVRSTQG